MNASPDLKINTDLARRILTGFIKSEITRMGFSRAVVNLSGGIDSALSCVLAAEALGPENVLAIRLPYKSSSADSLEHAQLVIDATGVNAMTLEITEMVDPLIAKFPEMNAGAQGQHHGAHAHDRALRPDGWPSTGWRWARAIRPKSCSATPPSLGMRPARSIRTGTCTRRRCASSRARWACPTAIIDKPPSADLWVGQTDEGELGYTYAEVDKLLYLLVDERYTPEECIEAGFASAFVRAVVERVRRNQFKRVLPPVAKLSHRTVGYDFLYLSDWGT